MSTGVVVNGYEIRNWHTVSILELARARREQGQRVAVPVKAEVSGTKKNRRSKDMSGRQAIEIDEEQVKGWVTATQREGTSWASLSRASGLSTPLIKDRVARFLEANPGFIETVVAAAVPPAPDEQMDEPESIVAAATEPVPVVEDVQALARERARELHAGAGDSRVIAVQELPLPLLARKQYSVPRILESGSVLSVNNPHAAAKLVEGLVAELNQIPGVQAYFEWRSEGRTGQPLGR